jgi:hypothetical protein
MVSTAPSAAAACADYVLRLSESLAHTHHANDRPLYQRLLADAASLLALLVRERDSAEIARAIQHHERLSLELFLSGPEHEAITDAWRRFTDAYGTPTI